MTSMKHEDKYRICMFKCNLLSDADQ